MSRKVFLIAGVLAFLMSVICVYFGSSIYNANANMHIQYLNEMDRIAYYDVEMVPALTRLAAIISIIFLTLILGIEIFIFIKTKVAATKRIALAIILIAVILLFMAILTIKNPQHYEFSKWGYAWVFGGLFTIAGNILSIFLKEKRVKP